MTGLWGAMLIAVLFGSSEIGRPAFAQESKDYRRIQTALQTFSDRESLRLSLQNSGEPGAIPNTRKSGQSWLLKHGQSQHASPLSAGRFWAGVGLGFAVHESGHLAANISFRSDVYVKMVSGAGIPFFAIAHRNALSRRREFVVSSAGLWLQSALSEGILTQTPKLRTQRSALKKGVIAFHVFTSVLYGVVGLTQIGPAERDTRSIAMNARWNERWVGVAVLSPGVLDAYRYLRPSATWAKWVSRASKVLLMLPLVL